ncbi:TPA: anti sigma factor C-terminal domain-containing protein [Clostridium botulinum]|nr:anti sigma factor C-terminal domain-containing protein [Clostridium botulinum]
MSKDIDDIFSNNLENEINKKIKSDRKKLNLKLTCVAVLSTLVIIILGNLFLNFLSNKYTAEQFQKELNIKTAEYLIKYPNEYIGHQRCIQTGYFKYQSTYDISKKIGSKVIYNGSLNQLGGLDKNTFSKESSFIDEDHSIVDNNINNRSSNEYGLRSLNFMYPYVDYENTINDFSMLDEISDNKTVEMALSFDKEYNYDEVNNFIDKDLITFYWVNTSNEENKNYEIENKSYEHEHSAIGIKSTDYNGATINDVNKRLEKFKYSLKFLIDNWEYGVVDYGFDLDNPKINGVVVVGTPNELKKLQNNSIIKHAILGTVTDKY